MKITILDRASLGADTPVDILSELGDLTVYDSSSPELVAHRCSDSDVIIINKVKITRDIIFSAENLKLICVFATGFDNVDIAAARERGVAVCNVPGYSSDSVALITASTVLALATHLNEYDEFVKSGRYTASGVPNKLTPVFHELKGKTWGIVGYGGIGKAVGKIAEALGANLLVCKREAIDSVRCVDIDTLCRESDVITLHCPLNEQTRALINDKRIRLMKKDVILVNEARGAVVDEAAIASAILNDRIGAFGCDVYSTEPFGEDHPYNSIIGRTNVIFTPHCAWGSYEARVRCLNIICDNIRSFNSGKMLNRVDI